MTSADIKAISSMKYLLEDVMEYWKQKILATDDPDLIDVITKTLDEWTYMLNKQSQLTAHLIRMQRMEIARKQGTPPPAPA
jgi:hypothetical protein